MLKTEDAVLILVALPGVDPDQVAAMIEDDALMVSGRRALPLSFGMHPAALAQRWVAAWTAAKDAKARPEGPQLAVMAPPRAGAEWRQGNRRSHL
ncbi:Hsp20/alpha crystallin family protein [Methylobacterium nodulans]|uniref:Hsp20/alpha crystallin family protein n=1 Tax=Methylobacterium nodulans TaxID=114616 RepID=UPI00030C77AD|nr:Hsp20/alpha crystallin family protein [Methylobacterium nodulans]